MNWTTNYIDFAKFYGRYVRHQYTRLYTSYTGALNNGKNFIYENYDTVVTAQRPL